MEDEGRTHKKIRNRNGGNATSSIEKRGTMGKDEEELSGILTQYVGLATLSRVLGRLLTDDHRDLSVENPRCASLEIE